MATLQLPEGFTVRKVKGSLKVVPMRKKVVIAKEKAMNGTEKQVKWAQDIYQEARAWGKANIEELKRVGLPEDFAKDLEQKFQSLVESKQDAKWWIDRRKLQLGVPAEYQDEISAELKKQIPPLRTAINAKYDLQWEIRGLRKG